MSQDPCRVHPHCPHSEFWSHHLSHLRAEFLLCCCKHGQGSCCCNLDLLIILPTQQHHQLQPVIAIGHKTLLNLKNPRHNTIREGSSQGQVHAARLEVPRHLPPCWPPGCTCTPWLPVEVGHGSQTCNFRYLAGPSLWLSSTCVKEQ